MPPRALAFLIAASFTIILIYVVKYVIKQASGQSSLIDGADGRPSTSKTQWWIWTVVVIFGYVAVFVERWRNGDPSVGTAVPQNLLLAMGFSGASAVGAKAVTTSYVARGLVKKTKAEAGSNLGNILTDDDGTPDLGKIQNIAFTVIALFVYVVKLATQGDAHTLPALVDIDPSLMLLMGLSDAGYLGAKLVTRDKPAADPGVAQ